MIRTYVHGFALLIAATLGTVSAGRMAAAEEGGVTVSAEFSHHYIATGTPQTGWLKIGLTGDRLAGKADRPPLNISLVLDRSGSMSGQKIRDTREAAKMLVDRLQASDTLSIITYSDAPQVLVPAGPVTDPESIKARIDTISADGGTALYSGVQQGASELREFFSEGQVNRVILLSDGHANIGPSSVHELGSLGGALIDGGISVSTIGLGLDFNEDLMTALAARSDGFHQFAENSRDLSRFFDWEFGKVSAVVASAVDVEVEFADGVRPIRTFGRGGRIEGNRFTANINQVFSAHEVYLLVEVELSGARTGDIASTRVTYRDIASGERHSVRLQTAAELTDDATLAEQSADPDVLIAATEQRAAAAQREAILLRDRGEVEQAQDKLEEISETLVEAGKLLHSRKLLEYGDTIRNQAKEFLDDRNWKKNRKDSVATMNKVEFQV